MVIVSTRKEIPVWRSNTIIIPQICNSLFCTDSVRVVFKVYERIGGDGAHKPTSVFPSQRIGLSVVVAEGITDGIVGDGSYVVACKQIRP